MKKPLRLGCVVTLFSVSLSAGAEWEPRAPSQPITYIRCGTLIDVLSAAPRKHILVRIQGNRIAGLSADRRASSREAGSRMIDLSGATCLPGLIDVHVHLINQDPQRRELRTPPQSLSAENLLRTLRYGFTTVRNLGTSGLGPSDLDVRNAVANGALPGPRLQVAICDVRARNFGVHGSPALRAAVDRIVDEGSEWIKVFGTLGPENELQYSEEELSAITDEAHKKGVKVAMHTIALTDSRRAIASHVDSVEHGVDISDADLKRMSESGITFVPTLFVVSYAATLPGRNDNAMWADRSKRDVDTFERALKAKVKIAFGTDAGAVGWTSNPAQQFHLMVSHGMTPLEAIQSATGEAAKLLGMDRQIGSIEVGKLADIVAVPDNPLADIRQLERVMFVMKDGQPVDLKDQ